MADAIRRGEAARLLVGAVAVGKLAVGVTVVVTLTELVVVVVAVGVT